MALIRTGGSPINIQTTVVNSGQALSSFNAKIGALYAITSTNGNYTITGATTLNTALGEACQVTVVQATATTVNVDVGGNYGVGVVGITF